MELNKEQGLSDRIVMKKNSRESLVISRNDYKGIDLVDIRTFFTNEEGNLSPTKKGVSIRLEKLDELIASLSAVAQDAQLTAGEKD
jgi:hypothetical protein